MEALGAWGRNLRDERQKGRKIPKAMRVRAREVLASRELANSAVGYLIRFGFVEAEMDLTEEELKGPGVDVNERQLRGAMRRLQRFYGLKQTGEADEATLKFMKRKRCGAKDVEADRPNRAKRYTLSRRQWLYNTLNYWFDPLKYTTDMPLADVRSEFEKALGMWAAVADVSFQEVMIKENADIKVKWEIGDHGDGYPFYGPGGVLAHAFYPRKGKLHFDDDEDYTKDTYVGINLLYVAVHELGHILGIKHADNSLEDAVMYALYKGYDENLQLHADDIAGAVAAMGAGSGTVMPLQN